MVVVDGRTDIEKLRELLATGTENSEVDFKETLDLSKKADELDFIKDAVSMFNRYPGGYIVIGATNEGEPSDLCADTDWKQFDGARLTDKIRTYVDAPLTAISALHEINGHTYCLICLMSLEDGLPVPFTKLGQYFDGKRKSKTVFRPGDITRRDGAQNRPIEYLQWDEILAQHDAVIREDESKRINTLIDKITLALGEKGKTPPLVVGMDDKSLATALEACFTQEETSKLIRYVNQLAHELSRSLDAVAELAAVATFAIAYSNDEIANRAIGALYDFYYSMDQYGVGVEERKLALVIAAYEIGAAMILSSRWEMISPFVNRQSPANGNYVFASWIRDCQVVAANAGKFDKGTGMMISLALNHIKKRTAILPDYDFAEREGDLLPSGTLSADEEAVLDLLCSFDFLYCLCVFVAGEGYGSAYPACVGFSQKRINAIVAKVFAKDDTVRRKLLPNNNDGEIADGLRELYHLIANEAMHKSKFVWGFDTTGTINSFLEANPSAQEAGSTRDYGLS